jgi:hypothetical protein
LRAPSARPRRIGLSRPGLTVGRTDEIRGPRTRRLSGTEPKWLARGPIDAIDRSSFREPHRCDGKPKYPGSGWHWPHAKAECAHRATFPDDRPRFAGYRSIMINLAINYFWYFRYDSSLAAGGSRSI